MYVYISCQFLIRSDSKPNFLVKFVNRQPLIMPVIANAAFCWIDAIFSRNYVSIYLL